MNHKCQKKREICHRHSRRQTVANRGRSAQRWLHRRGRRQCESFSVRLSRCAGLVLSLTPRRVTGEIEKLTPSSRQAEGASLLEHLRSRSSAAPAPCDRADPLGSTDGEVRMGAQPPLVVMVFECGCFYNFTTRPIALRTGAADSSANHVLQRGAGLSVRCRSEAVRLSRRRHQFACATGRVDCELQQRRP